MSSRAGDLRAPGCRYFPRGCSLDPTHHAMALAFRNPDGTHRVVCCHCGDDIYGEALVIANHDFVCQGERMSVVARDLGATVHMCTETFTDQLDRLLADIGTPAKEVASST